MFGKGEGLPVVAGLRFMSLKNTAKMGESPIGRAGGGRAICRRRLAAFST